MKITIYELLGLIKDGKAPKKIKYCGCIYEWEEDWYLTKEKNCRVCLGGKSEDINQLYNAFNENVEILDDKFIKEQREHKKQLLNKLAKNYNLKVVEDVEDKSIPKHLTNEFIQGLDKYMTKQDIKHIAHKVNEIINYLQHISKEDK